MSHGHEMNQVLPLNGGGGRSHSPYQDNPDLDNYYDPSALPVSIIHFRILNYLVRVIR
jgi:hypothetical protein